MYVPEGSTSGSQLYMHGCFIFTVFLFILRNIYFGSNRYKRKKNSEKELKNI